MAGRDWLTHAGRGLNPRRLCTSLELTRSSSWNSHPHRVLAPRPPSIGSRRRTKPAEGPRSTCRTPVRAGLLRVGWGKVQGRPGGHGTFQDRAEAGGESQDCWRQSAGSREAPGKILELSTDCRRADAARREAEPQSWHPAGVYTWSIPRLDAASSAGRGVWRRRPATGHRQDKSTQPSQAYIGEQSKPAHNGHQAGQNQNEGSGHRAFDLSHPRE